MTRTAGAVLLVVAAAVAAVLLNLLLLDRASGGTERIGRLQPVTSNPTTPAPQSTVHPREKRGSDDHGRNRGRDSDD
jgi:hypothetical protein